MMITTQEQLEQANQILTDIRIKEAIPASFEYNPAYTPENRDLILKHTIEKELSKLGGKIVIAGGEAKVMRADNPELELYDQAQSRVTLQSLVSRAIAPLSVHGAQPQPVKQDKTEYVQMGNMTYVFKDPAEKYRQPRTHQQHLDQLSRELDIRP